MVEIMLYTDSLHLELRIDATMVWAIMQMIVHVVSWLVTHN